MIKRLRFIQFTLLFCGLCCYNILQAQTNLECDDELTINSLTSQDIIIPNTSQLTISLRGGDGGDVDFGKPCNTLIRGGGGASVAATFKVGSTGEALRPGGKLRIFVGQSGQTRNVTCANGGRVSGAGGGSSAILYLPPGKSATGLSWQLLAIAGGGGGATRPAAGVKRTGLGGSSSINGINTGGNRTGAQGRCPDDSNAATPPGYGGGYNCEPSDDEAGESMVLGLNNNTIITLRLKDNSQASSTGGDTNNRPDGGDGFTGGGSAGEGGGGGGGFYGGAAAAGWPGGGGGSYVQSNVFSPSNTGTTGGGNGGGTRRNGFVKVTTTSTPPLARCIAETIELDLDQNGAAQVSIEDLDDGSDIQFCNGEGALNLGAGIALVPSPLNVNCSFAKEFSLQLVLLDPGGNFNSACVVNVKINDKIAPNAVCKPNYTLELDPSGNATLDPAALDNGSTDNCSLNFSASRTQFDCTDISVPFFPNPIDVTLTVTDRDGQSSTCQSQVTVKDVSTPRFEL